LKLKYWAVKSSNYNGFGRIGPLGFVGDGSNKDWWAKDVEALPSGISFSCGQNMA